MAKLTIVEAVNLALTQEMKKDKDVIVLGEDVGINGGVFRATDGLIQKYRNRVFDTPLSEAGIVGSSIGMAVYGLKPVCEIQFSGFIHPSFNQIISHAGRIRARSRGRFTVPMVVRSPYAGGIHAPEHHSESIEAILVHVPGIKVVIPSTPYDTKGLLVSAIRDPDPVIFLEPKKIYRAFREEVPEREYTIPLGKARVVKEGKGLTLIAWGAMVRPSLEAVDLAEKEKISVEVIDLRTLSPIDHETIINSVGKTGRVVIVHEAPKTCGLGAEIAAIISEESILNLEAPIERVTGFDTIFPLSKLENYYLPSKERIFKAIKRIAEF